MNKDEFLFYCDWGTTSFRMYLVSSASPERVLQSFNTDIGIQSVFLAWDTRIERAERRIDFYREVLLKAKREFDCLPSYVLEVVPVLISGMASSSIGMEELPYAWVPFTDKDYQFKKINADQNFRFDVFLFSGIRNAIDVMRGEETQCLGLLSKESSPFTDQENILFILPGTHSKHVRVNENAIIDFETFLTGEMFGLLKEHSVLKHSVTDGGNGEPVDEKSFLSGVNASVNGNFLQLLFEVRTNALFKKLNACQNYYFLSGLVIGTELSSTRVSGIDCMVLCGTKKLNELYGMALGHLFANSKILVMKEEDVNASVILGLTNAYKNCMLYNEK